MDTNVAEQTRLSVKRVLPARCDKVFRAWTDPAQLREWFHVGDAWTTPVHEIDLKVGGTYRLGMQSPEGDSPYIVHGVYREIVPNRKLVFTWQWEGEDAHETLVTITFRDLGDKTEIELVHERFPTSEMRDKHEEGWMGCLQQLAAFCTA